MTQHADRNYYHHSSKLIDEKTDEFGYEKHETIKRSKDGFAYSFKMADVKCITDHANAVEILALMNESYHADSMPTMTDQFGDWGANEIVDTLPTHNINDGDLYDQLTCNTEFEKMGSHYLYYVNNTQRWRKRVNGRLVYTPNETKANIKLQAKIQTESAKIASDARYFDKLSFRLDILKAGHANNKRRKYVTFPISNVVVSHGKPLPPLTWMEGTHKGGEASKPLRTKKPIRIPKGKPMAQPKPVGFKGIRQPMSLYCDLHTRVIKSLYN